MRKCVLAILGVMGIISWWIISSPPSPPLKSIDFKIIPVLSTNTFSRQYLVTVSNASEYPLQYTGDGKKLWFHIAFASNNIPRNEYRRTDFGYTGLFAPHEVKTDFVSIPVEVKKFKIGIEIISLTWRGKLAWQSIGSRFSDALRPLTLYLIQQDEKRRSKTEWSDDYVLP